jgi:hypothetical protein
MSYKQFKLSLLRCKGLELERLISSTVRKRNYWTKTPDAPFIEAGLADMKRTLESIRRKIRIMEQS